MHRRAEKFLTDWALQHVGSGAPLGPTDPETAEIVTRLLRAARAAGVPEAALRDAAALNTLVVGVRALANGQSDAALRLGTRRTSS
ncbi:hypothetical protein [Iodidimonas sp. SYSU 1G8]|uniref:hypothetical protein n=1 Tax=Iodidimonas sp. SYSU 1G8 TaxID=3133967 RepID=UPI0031FEA6DE